MLACVYIVGSHIADDNIKIYLNNWAMTDISDLIASQEAFCSMELVY
jgi:hypothetical protein